MRVPFLRLEADYREVAAEVRRRFDAVLESQCFVLGPQTRELEERLCTLVGGHAVACSSGSEALY
ncbi:MAG: aminotransferase DegT, partial [Deltaproteobacteria bacterium]